MFFCLHAYPLLKTGEREEYPFPNTVKERLIARKHPGFPSMHEKASTMLQNIVFFIIHKDISVTFTPGKNKYTTIHLLTLILLISKHIINHKKTKTTTWLKN